MLLHSSKNYGSVLTCTTDEYDGGEVVDCNTSGFPSQWLPFILESVELVNAPQVTSCQPDE